MAAAEDRLDGAIAYRALVRYDAYGEMSGHQSTTIALLDADHNGVVLSSIAHRDTARLYCKQVHAGRGEHQLSPEEEEAVRLALAGEVGSRHLGDRLRAAYLGPPGTVSDEALTAAAPEFEAVPLVDAARRRALRAGGAGRARAGAGRERARGRRGPGARRAGAGGAGRRADRRGRPAGRPTAWPPAASWRSTRSRWCSRTRRRSGSARAGWPSTCRGAARGARGLDRRRGARGGAATASGTRAAIGPRLAARRYGAVMLAEGLEDDPGNATRFAWLRPRGRRAAAARERAGQDRAGVLGRRLGLARAGSCPAWRCSPSRGVNLTRIESRPLRRGMGEYMFFLDLEGSMADPAVSGAVAGAAHARRGGSSPRLVPPRRAEMTVRRYRYTPRNVATAVPPGPLGSVPLGDHPRHGPESDGSSSRWSGGRVLVLNATYEPINVCTVRRATVLLLKDKAEVVEIGTQDLHWATGSLPRPVVIRLVTYVRIPRDTHKRKITRRAVFARDGWMCQYCGARTIADGRPRDPALQGRRLGLGQHRRLLRAVQPPQGRPAAAPDQHAPAHQAAHAGRAHLHPARVADDPGDLAAVPARAA